MHLDQCPLELQPGPRPQQEHVVVGLGELVKLQGDVRVLHLCRGQRQSVSEERSHRRPRAEQSLGQVARRAGGEDGGSARLEGAAEVGARLELREQPFQHISNLRQGWRGARAVSAACVDAPCSKGAGRAQRRRGGSSSSGGGEDS